jgi:hypothetical protein
LHGENILLLFHLDIETEIYCLVKKDIKEKCMRVLVTVSCSKAFDNVESIEEAEKLFRKEVNHNLNPDKVHQVLGMDCTDDEDDDESL